MLMDMMCVNNEREESSPKYGHTIFYLLYGTVHSTVIKSHLKAYQMTSRFFLYSSPKTTERRAETLQLVYIRTHTYCRVCTLYELHERL